VQAWQVYAGALLGLPFTGANNDTVGEAVWGWVTITRAGLLPFVGQLHASSLRGMVGGAFYYPWWLLAAAGLAASGADNRRWSLAVIAAALIPAIAFSPRFNLPRVAYFCYPAVYLLAARGIEATGGAAARIAGQVDPAVKHAGPRVSRSARLAAGVAVALVAVLVAIANVDVVGDQQLNVWFHYSQGNGW